MAMFPSHTIIESGFYDGVNGAVATYVPTLAEFMLGLGGLAVAVIATLIAVRVLPFLPATLSDEATDPHH
jgi:molybdopterin-containing oxidoreductase family membrane subunit